ncbi:tetratricopeptide repeat protein [Candidatus Nitronereus thalassa]|uniref:Tetratricopeptide repeat protein n=1 Tax=Candidatus Nitronereus thalassa TaxID=3020898 RepID=A0ABU3K969_9BACT|nr:tetratricopeptide repeat protein [Candidatus Nitronereus thalassa]MDT7043000.1 tetratricopeptide repeat protein [Candidatus Nitronereus thalassa]
MGVQGVREPFMVVESSLTKKPRRIRLALFLLLNFLYFILTPFTPTSSLVYAQDAIADVLVAEVILAIDDQRFDEALTLITEALESSPDHLEALYYKGVVLMALDRLDEAIVTLEHAQEQAPNNISIAFQLGVAYFSKSEYDKAEPLLLRVFEEQPATKNLGYYIGFMRYRHKNYQGALQAFQVGASDDPRILQLTRFYSGLALAILGLPEKAADELGEAMRVRTVSPITGPADRLRDSLAAAKTTEDRLHGQVQVGAFYDSNVAVIPQSTGEPTIEELRKQKSEASGALASFRLDYSWLRHGPVESSLSYSFFHNGNNQLSDFNVVNHLGALGLFYRGLMASMPFQTGIQFTVDNTELGGEQFLRRYSGTVFGTLVESQHHLTTIQGGVQSKGFEELDLSQVVSPALRAALEQDVRSATNWMAGITHIIRFEQDRHLIRGGFQIDRDAAIGENFDYTGYRLQAGGLYTLPWFNIRLRYDYDVHFRMYDSPNTRFSRTGLLPTGITPHVTQTVTEQTHIVRIEKSFPNNITLAMDWQNTFSRSNIDILFNFDRQVISWTAAWAF